MLGTADRPGHNFLANSFDAFWIKDLNEIACCIVWGKQGEIRAGAWLLQTVNPARKSVVRERIDFDLDRLPDSYSFQLGFFEVRQDPDIILHAGLRQCPLVTGK